MSTMNSSERTNLAKDQACPKDRLLAAADTLFYEEGVRRVGVDRIIEVAGVAKASLYSAFGSKDELVRSYLAARHARFSERVSQELPKRYATPEERVLGVFDLLGELCAEPSYRGCAFINANAEAEAGGGIAQATEAFRGWLRDLFLDLCRAAGVSNPEGLAQQLVLLYDGASVKAHLDHDVSAATTARGVAKLLIEAALARD